MQLHELSDPESGPELRSQPCVPVDDADRDVAQRCGADVSGEHSAILY